MKTYSILLKLCLILLLIPASAPSLSAAEIESEWSVILYDHGLNGLVRLSLSGHDIVLLPDIGYAGSFSENDSWRYVYPYVKLTDDQHYLVSIIGHPNSSATEAVITDLTTQEIIPIAIPPLSDTEFFVRYTSGAFNPAMTEVVLPYLSHDAASGFGCCGSGGIVTVALATGAITHLLDIDANYNAPTAWVDYWTVEGIWFTPTSMYLQAYSLWKPDTDTVLTTDVFYDREKSEQLETTGELLYSENHPDFPLGGPTSFPELNTVVLYQPDEYPPDAPGQVVYYDIDNIAFDGLAHWVMNGQAFLVTNEYQHNVVVFRDGHQVTIDYPDPEHFIAMTSDGWLTFERTAQQIRHYVVSDTSITGTMLYQASGQIEVANIQASPETSAFSPFAIEIAPPDIFFCPGALPSRLKPGDWAEVLVDQQVVRIAALNIGDVEFDDVTWGSPDELLPLGARVQIVGESGCTPHGWSYIKAKYQDKVGWMLELHRMEYYLQPVNP